MTTIAYRDGVLASDSRETTKSRIDTDRCKKIFRLADGGLFGASGESSGIIQMLDRLKAAIAKTKPGQPTVLPDNVKGINALLVDLNKNSFYYERGVWAEFDYPYAIGSGSDYAMAALDMGATAVEAVKTAIKRDIYSGGRVQVLELKRKKK